MAKVEQAVILCGGLGTRLGELTKSTPKPLLPVGGKPFLEHVIFNLRRHGFRDIVLSAGHLADTIAASLGDGSSLGVHLTYSVETEPLGTGGAVAYASNLLADRFLLLNGDTLFDINYLDLAMVHDRSDALATLALRRVEDTGRYGRVLVSEHRVTAFAEKTTGGEALINGGVYLIDRAALQLLPEGKSSIEQDLFPTLCHSGRLAGKDYTGFFIDIGLPETLRSADVLVPEWLRRPAVFFDRDGVLNVDHGYVHKEEHFEWIEGAPEAIKWLNDHGYYVFVVTNQAGIGRGYYGESHFLRFTDWIQDCLAERGAHIDETVYCPHHPVAGQGPYKVACNCRKPGSRMLLNILETWPIQKDRSLLIGDKASDIEAAKGAGIQGYLFSGGNLRDFLSVAIDSGT